MFFIICIYIYVCVLKLIKLGIVNISYVYSLK